MDKKIPFELLLIILIVTACAPRIKEGEKISTGKEYAEKYWEQYMVEHTGDTLQLSESGAVLLSRFSVKNFHISLSLCTEGGAEGEIAFHTEKSTGTIEKGYSVKINNSDYRQGHTEKTGSLSLIRNNYVRMVPEGEWCSLQVDVRGNVIQVMVNDKLISEYIEPAEPIRIPELKGRILDKGHLVIRKTNDSGSITVANILVETYSDNIQVIADSVFHYDSTGIMLTKLNQLSFPVIDYHAHLKGGLTIDQVSQHGRLNGYNYGIAPNCGLHFPVTNDSSLLEYFYNMKPEPVFKAMQCEGREWITLFSPEAVAHYDYIFTDAMTWTDHKGRRMRLWIPEETFVDDEQQFMDMLVGKIESILSNEPVDIYVNPTYLPDVLAKDYDRLWTAERMDRVIRALVEHDVALEINSRYRIPSIAFIKRAKDAGVKFTLGTNNAGSDDLGRLEYSLEAIEKAGIQPSDMFLPQPEGSKKVMKQGLPAKITG